MLFLGYPERSRRNRLAMILLLGGLSLILGACDVSVWKQNFLGPSAPQRSTQELATALALTHGQAAWHAQQAMQAELEVDFGAQRVLDGRLTLETGLKRSRLDLKNGATMVFDGNEAWIAPASATVGRARFHLRTWAFFLSAPMWIGQPGTSLEPLEEGFLQGQRQQRAKLTLNGEATDLPCPWFILYADPATRELTALAYACENGAASEGGDRSPHAVTYDRYETIGGVRLATAWTFWRWDKDLGLIGDPIGSARLSNLRFVPAEGRLFARPADARADRLLARQ